MTNNKIDDHTTKASFLKNGGSIQKWNEYRNLVDDVKRLENEATYWKGRATVTEEIIKSWQLNSLDIFNEVDNQSVDFILTSEDLEGKGFFGANRLSFNSNGMDFKNPVGFEGYFSRPAISIVISQDVNISTPDIETGGYSLNHEAGHFLFIVNNSEYYFRYYKKLEREKRSFNGGHNEDDYSGELAKIYGGKKTFRE